MHDILNIWQNPLFTCAFFRFLFPFFAFFRFGSFYMVCAGFDATENRNNVNESKIFKYYDF